jgi:catechol 2,3-dioxygenase-like lactoylglutathione lyase family enzyme
MKSILVLLALALSSCKAGESQEPPAALPLAAGTGAVFALSVPDLEASVRWYSDKIGLRVTLRPPKQGKTSIAILEADGWLVELQQHDDALPLQTVAPAVSDRTLVHGPFKVGVMVANLSAAITLLGERQVPIAFGPFPATASQKANLIIRDNAGNLLQLIAK